MVSLLSPVAQAAEFEVAQGYLSASVRQIVDGYGWSLVWAADEDRVIEHPFTVENGSLREGLANLLAIYRGQFVADLFEGNRVVLVDAAPPRIRVVLPGEGLEGESPDRVATAPPSPPDAYPAGAAVAGSALGPALLTATREGDSSPDSRIEVAERSSDDASVE